MKKIVLASNNEHKINEFKEILKDYEILSLKDIGYEDDIVEDGNTFEDNALIKAREVKKFLKDKDYLIIADDSGLCVDSLDGEPGIYSARYAGGHGNSKANRDKLIDKLKNKDDRNAYFLCCIVLYKNEDDYKFFIGKTYGTIIDQEKGDTSFGYDCIFLSNDLNKTFGEASDEEKNSVSHRGRAIEKLVKELTN